MRKQRLIDSETREWVGRKIAVEWVTSSLVICLQMLSAYHSVIFYKYTIPQPRAACHLGKGVLFKSQSKCIIMNVHNSVSKDNPTMTQSEILNKVADMCRISVHSHRKLVTQSNKLGPVEPFTTPKKNSESCQ